MMKRFVSMLTAAVLIAAMFPAALYAAPEKGATAEKGTVSEKAATAGGKLVLKKLKKGKKYQVKVCALVADSGSYDRGAYSKVKTSKKIK